MKFKSILLALCLGVTGFCMAADAAPAANAGKPAVVQTAPAAAEAVADNTADSNSTKPAEQKSSSGSLFQMLLPIILIVVMIFLFSRSNKKQQQKRQEMLDRIVKGSRVMLNSGVYGKISEVRENEFLVEIADGVKVLVIKNGVASVEDEEEKKSEEAK